MSGPAINIETGKLGPNAVFVFSLVTLGVVIGVTKLMPHVAGPITPKAMAAVYFALFGAGAALAALFSRAGAIRTIGAFALGGIGLGVFHYLSIARHMEAAGATIAAGTGLVFAVMFAFAALGAGIAGTLFGLKFRKGLARPIPMPRER